jgi:hypothetical protein
MTAQFEEVGFAGSAEEASQRYERFGAADPFPLIVPALLNGRDVLEYTRVTAMIHPIGEASRRKPKAASLPIEFLGEVHEMDEYGQLRPVQTIELGTRFVLRKNSIAFVYLRTQFRLPLYIAVRFNLQIRHVHKGLLLGTGPLVDPGFCGNLLIPLHNLTAQEYVLTGGDPFIWVEFTKLSPGMRDPGQVSAPPAKSAADYFRDATGGGVPASSIPQVITNAERAAGEAQKAAESANAAVARFATISAIAAVALLMAVCALMQQVWSTARGAQAEIAAARTEMAELRATGRQAQADLGRLHGELVEVSRVVKELTEQRTRPGGDGGPPPEDSGPGKPPHPSPTGR